MTDKTHLDTFVKEAKTPLQKGLVEEFSKLVRDPSAEPSSYSVNFRELMEEHMRAVDNAAN